MSVEVLMPKFGLTMQEGTVQRWFHCEGESVKQGAPLFEVETEKVLYEVDAPADGVLARILAPPGSTVPVASVVAVIAEPGEDPAVVASRYTAPQPGGRAGEAVQAQTSSASASAATAEVPGLRRREGPPVTPAARRLARDLGVDLGSVRGTGPGGRITRQDVERAAAKAGAGGAAPEGAGAAERIPMVGARRTIAERMLRSLQSSAQITLTTEADVTPLVERRKRLDPAWQVTYTDMVIEAVAGALRAHPLLNSRVEGDAIVLVPEVHIGVAVAVEHGLMVPVIRDADRKPLPAIAAEARSLAERARAGKLSPDELVGGTFTITNLGPEGIDAFTPILNPPQAAILGVGRIVPKPAVFNGAICIRSLMHLSLTFDHRILDGAPAAAFLAEIVRRLQEGPSTT